VQLLAMFRGLALQTTAPFNPLRARLTHAKMHRSQDQERAIAVSHLFETCGCGKVKLEVVGRPILTASCYCASCQEAGRRFEQLASARPVLNPDGGTDYVLYRKDRVRCVTGQEHLEEHRLKPESPTRRVIATCCNSAVFADFTKGHWLSLYRNRLPNAAPPVEMRVMTRDRRDGVALADDLPNYDRISVTFMLKLIAAWIAMGLRRPDITWGKQVRGLH